MENFRIIVGIQSGLEIDAPAPASISPSISPGYPYYPYFLNICLLDMYFAHRLNIKLDVPERFIYIVEIKGTDYIRIFEQSFKLNDVMI